MNRYHYQNLVLLINLFSVQFDIIAVSLFAFCDKKEKNKNEDEMH